MTEPEGTAATRGTWFPRRKRRRREPAHRRVLVHIVRIWALLAAATKDIRPTRGMQVYDCTDSNSGVQVIDLTRPADCPDPVKDYLPPEEHNLELLQTDAEYAVEAHTCSITYTRKVSVCGFNSLSYANFFTAFEKTYLVTPNECREAVSSGKIAVMGKEYIVGAGISINDLYFTHGSMDGHGWCYTTEKFQSEGVAVESGVEQMAVKIKITQVRGTASGDTGRVRFVNGLTAQWGDGVVRDEAEGTIIWDATAPRCKDTVSGIYLGKGTVHRRTNSSYLESIVMVENGETGQYAGVVIRGVTSVCGVHCYATQVDGLAVCVHRLGDGVLETQRKDFLESFPQGLVRSQTELGHLYLATNLRMYRRFETVQGDICELERKILHSKLQALAGARNRYALLDLFGRGHEVYISGTVAYVIKCVPKEATLRSYPNCTTEVPVKVDQGGDRPPLNVFADPLTWVIRPHAQEIPCSPITPVRWLIGGQWYCSTPETIACPRPYQLNTTVNTFHAVEFTRRIGHSAYTHSQLQGHEDLVEVQTSTDAVMGKIVTEAIKATRRFRRDTVAMSEDPWHDIESTSNGILPIGGIVVPYASVAEFTDDLKDRIIQSLFPWMGFLGSFFLNALGTIVLFGMVSTVLSALIRGIVLYRQRGCGWWLLGALWGTAFAVIQLPIEAVRNTWRENQRTLGRGFGDRPGRRSGERRSDDHDDDDDGDGGDDDDDAGARTQSRKRGFLRRGKKKTNKTSDIVRRNTVAGAVNAPPPGYHDVETLHFSGPRIEEAMQEMVPLTYRGPGDPALTYRGHGNPEPPPPPPPPPARQEDSKADSPVPPYREEAAALREEAAALAALDTGRAAQPPPPPPTQCSSFAGVNRAVRPKLKLDIAAAAAAAAASAATGVATACRSRPPTPATVAAGTAATLGAIALQHVANKASDRAHE